MLVQLRKKYFYQALIICTIIMSALSCQKDLDYIETNPTILPDLVTKVTSSVSGFVTDENNQAVLGASVSGGAATTTTDKYGYFELNNVQVVKTAAVVTVNQPGYFKGIKTYIAEDNKAAFFRIKLIPKTNAGSINATSGGNITLSNGLIVALPANAVVNAATNAAYSGSVNVAAHWIDPVAPDLNMTMPGDLRGTASDGTLKLLTTYGMAAVELTGSGGELLQIAAGKKATLTLTIPASLMASAPSTIPLWSFDEAKGLWKQEGQANKTGNTYVGEVSHFSFWNCDVPNSYVQFNCTVKDATGNPISNAWVKITNTANGAYGSGFTDATGYVGGAVPDNAQLLLEIFTGYYCGTPIYSQNFNTTNVNVALGDITVSTNLATVSGTITDCNNAPVSNGRIILQQTTGSWFYNVYSVNNGSFSFVTPLCNGTLPVNIIAEDLTAMQQSTPLSVTLSAGANAIGNLQACGVNIQEYITYSVDGGTTTTQLIAPGDSIFHTVNNSTFNNYIYGYTPGTNNTIEFGFDGTGIGAGSSQALVTFNTTQTGQGTVVGTVNITEYGNVGQFIAGTLTGTLVTTTSTYNLVCSFRTRRNF